MKPFDPAQFQNESATELGQKLWVFLNRADIFGRGASLGRLRRQPVVARVIGVRHAVLAFRDHQGCSLAVVQTAHERS